MELLKITLNGAPHFVRCFKPNKGTTSLFDEDYIGQQLRYTGILQIVAARQEGFSYRLTFAEFLRRYCFLGFSFDERVLATRENCQLLLLRLRMDGYALGKSKVFLKYYHIEYLSKQYEYQIRKIIRVQAVVRRWLASLRCQKEKWAVARHLFLMRIFVSRWKIRAKIKTNVSKSIPPMAVVAEEPKSPAIKPGVDAPMKKVRSKSTAAVEIQRHIRGYFARKKIGQLLARKVEQAVKTNDAEEVSKVKDELKDEGLTEDEAARLIQSVFRKLRTHRSLSKDSLNNDKRVDDTGGKVAKVSMSKLNDLKVQKKCAELMQLVHLNNVDIHKFLKRNKGPVDIADVKKIDGFHMSSVRPSLPSIHVQDSLDSNKYEEDVDDIEFVSTDNGERRFSMTCFYNDSGPRDNWDAPLSKHVKQMFKTMGLKGRTNAKAVASMQELNPSQALISATHSSDLLSDMQRRVMPSHAKPSLPMAPTEPLPRSKTTSDIHTEVEKLPRRGPSYIEHLQAIGKKTGANQEDVNDERGPYDFRALLKKTEFAPTASLRRRKGGNK